MGERVFYFDFISPFAWLAWAQLGELEQRHAVEFRRQPVLFAGLLNAHGQLGPAEIPAKARWVYRHVARQAHRHGIPIAPPAFHPFNPLLALRVVQHLQASADLDRVIDALFRAVWVDALHVAEPATVRTLLAGLGLDAEAVLAGALSPPTKQGLREATDRAVADGVFGVPSLRIDGELFWGFDDLPNLDRFLAGEDPLGPQWRDRQPTPSAQRR